MCLIYLLLILQLNQFILYLCHFSPCLQGGRMGICGFFGAWKELTEMFPLQLDLFLEIFCSTGTWGQAECLSDPPGFLSPIKH